MTPTGKVVVWGHWIVGLLAAAITVANIWGIVGNTVSMEHGARFGPQVLIADSLFAVFGMICGLCAWGILRWRPWGHVLALGIFTLEKVVDSLNGTAAFTTLEEGLHIEIKFNHAGHADLFGRARSQTAMVPEQSVLSFSFETDQSFLARTVRELKGIVTQFPIRKPSA